MFQVLISDQQSVLPVDERKISEIVRTILQAENVAAAEIVVVLVDDAQIHLVNREHLQHDYPTDVISFLYESGRATDAGGSAAPQAEGRILDGELVISTETARREADRYGWQPQDELTLYLVHGLLHLCGYDDQTPQDQAAMRTREQSILKFWNLTPHYGE